MKRKRYLIVLLALFTHLSFAETTLGRLFSDHMVIQQRSAVAIWGKDTANQNIVVRPSWGGRYTTKTDASGQWQLKIKTPQAGGPHHIAVTGTTELILADVMIGEVWLASGQSNMEMPVLGFTNQPVQNSQQVILASRNSHIRIFTVDRQYTATRQATLTGGHWQVAAPNTTGQFSASAYFFAQQLEHVLNIPIGVIVTSWGGSTLETWMSRETLTSVGKTDLPLQLPDTHHLIDKTSKIRVQQIPTLLYNGMLSPLFGYPIKGAIWYQGESNIGRPNDYLNHFPQMVKDWRKQWGIGQFPFYYTQIAPYHYDNVNSAYLRDAQRMALPNIPNSGMAVTLDSNECHAIHPSNKRIVGQRLAFLALANDYGINGFDSTGPQLANTKIAGPVLSITLTAKPTGITSFGKPIEGFEIAGEDRIFHPADAVIKRHTTTIELSAAAVPEPVAARYAFNNCPKYSIFSTQGLPLSSFRTDTW